MIESHSNSKNLGGFSLYIKVNFTDISWTAFFHVVLEAVQPVLIKGDASFLLLYGQLLPNSIRLPRSRHQKHSPLNHGRNLVFQYAVDIVPLSYVDILVLKG